jgi:hypothetical protein
MEKMLNSFVALRYALSQYKAEENMHNAYFGQAE